MAADMAATAPADEGAEEAGSADEAEGAAGGAGAAPSLVPVVVWYNLKQFDVHPGVLQLVKEHVGGGGSLCRNGIDLAQLSAQVAVLCDPRLPSQLVEGRLTLAAAACWVAGEHCMPCASDERGRLRDAALVLGTTSVTLTVADAGARGGGLVLRACAPPAAAAVGGADGG
jgi:hypothetical protein